MYKTAKMVIVKEILSDYKEDYEKALSLINKESKTDPPNEPYRSLYAAKELLLGIQENLENVLASILAAEAEDGKKDFTYKVLLAYVQKNLGYIYAKTEEPTLGEKYLRRCIGLIESHKMHPAAIIPYIGALNELGNVLENVENSQEALEWLELSEKVYNDFKAIENAEAISITDLFGTIEELEKKNNGSDELENQYTICTFTLARVYENLMDLDKFISYSHNSLRRQLDSNSYESIDFASTAANLSQYFLIEGMLKEGRHHLAMATWIMAEHKAKMITPEMSEATIDDVKETFKRHYADLARLWAKYGLILLSLSKDRLLLDDCETSMIDMIENLTIVEPNEFRFPNLQLEVYENSVSTMICLNLDDAKLIFQFVVNWLDQAKAYYKLDTKPTEYAEIIKDYAELYKLMAFFQKNPLNNAKMRKRCAIYYEELIDVLNPIDYLDICRECWYGAGITYCAIVEIFCSQKNPSLSHYEKINQFCQKAIKNLLEFQKSYMENDCIILKNKLNTEEIREVMCSHFHLGSIYYKMVTSDPALQLENMKNSYKYIKTFCDDCKKYKKVAETLKQEICISKEMLFCLPLEIANIKKTRL